jgi:hypothetical protein
MTKIEKYLNEKKLIKELKNKNKEFEEEILEPYLKALKEKHGYLPSVNAKLNVYTPQFLKEYSRKHDPTVKLIEVIFWDRCYDSNDIEEIDRAYVSIANFETGIFSDEDLLTDNMRINALGQIYEEKKAKETYEELKKRFG